MPALLLASVASAQGVTTSLEDEIREAYRNFRTSGSTYTFELTGQEIYGRIVRPLHAVLYYRLGRDARTGGDSAVQVELDVFERNRDGSERYAQRIVGDGTNLYRYDLDRGEVMTTTYGFYGLNVPPRYPDSDAPKLLAQLRTATPGPAAYLVRLLGELNPRTPDFEAWSRTPATQLFTEWLPGRTGRIFDTVPYPLLKNSDGERVQEPSITDVVTDPITGRLFSRGDEQAQKYAFYGFDRPNTDRTVAFTMDDPRSDEEKRRNPDPRWQVRSVNVAQRSADRTLDLTLTPGSSASPAWAFVPYTGAEAAKFRPMNVGGR